MLPLGIVYSNVSMQWACETVFVIGSTHLHDLKDVTCDVHYENFRIGRIRQQQNPAYAAAE